MYRVVFCSSLESSAQKLPCFLNEYELVLIFYGVVWAGGRHTCHSMVCCHPECGFKRLDFVFWVPCLPACNMLASP